MGSKKLSFIVPVYNVRPYIGECLESVLRQEHAWEVVCVNDGSTDGSEKLLEEFAKRDGRIKIIHQENKGPSASRNTGLGAATGDYITFLDGDDWISRDFSTTAQKIIQARRPDLIVFNGMVVDQVKNQTFPFYDSHFIYKVTKDEAVKKMDGKMNPLYFLLEPNTSKRVYSRNFLLRGNIQFPEMLSLNEDVPVHFEVGLLTRNIVITRKIGFFYRKANPSSLTMDNGERRLQVVGAHQKTLEKLSSHNALDDVYVAFIHSLVCMGWWCHAQAVDPKIKRKIKSDISKIIRSLDKKHVEGYLCSDNFPDEEKKKFFAIWHNAPAHITKRLSFKFLRGHFAPVFFKLISKF